MSQTMEGIDAKGYLGGWLVGVTDMYIKDIKAMPEDQLFKTAGGVARPANELTADAVALLGWTAEAMRGNVVESYGEDGFKGLAAKMSTKESMCSVLKAASEDFGKALAECSDERLNSMVTPPWKMEAPLFILAQIAVSHLWYHDGQLNFIQALNGDESVHWMDESN